MRVYPGQHNMRRDIVSLLVWWLRSMTYVGSHEQPGVDDSMSVLSAAQPSSRGSR